jgi:hypothetical protein
MIILTGRHRGAKKQGHSVVFSLCLCSFLCASVPFALMNLSSYDILYTIYICIGKSLKADRDRIHIRSSLDQKEQAVLISI